MYNRKKIIFVKTWSYFQENLISFRYPFVDLETITSKWRINFAQNGSCDQKMLQIKYFYDDKCIIWFLL